jgi:hypothetical protein
MHIEGKKDKRSLLPKQQYGSKKSHYFNTCYLKKWGENDVRVCSEIRNKLNLSTGLVSPIVCRAVETVCTEYGACAVDASSFR